MIYILENDELKVKVASMGAELRSVLRPGDGTEYLWQGNPAYWTGRAPNLFPFCGRMVEGRYTYDGETYELPIHGFAGRCEWTVVRQKSNVLTLQLTDSEATRVMYPFRFTAQIVYTLEGDELTVTYIVRNDGDKTMLFGLGGHPGINVPLEPGRAFTDYLIEFDAPCAARRLSLSDACFYLNASEPFPLEDGRILRLRHELFDRDAIFLRDTPGGLTLRAEDAVHSVHMRYADMPFIGLWHRPHSDAPYVCLEPWHGVPALDGHVNDLTEIPELISLPAGETSRSSFSVAFR